MSNGCYSRQASHGVCESDGGFSRQASHGVCENGSNDPPLDMGMARMGMAHTMQQVSGFHKTRRSESKEAASSQHVLKLETKQNDAASLIWKLNQGNRRFVSGRGGPMRQSTRPLIDMLIDDPLRPTQVQALVISCARSFAPIDRIFDAEPGDLQVVRVCGNVCEPRDGVVGSVEFALESVAPPLLVVLGNSRNDAVECAVRCAMLEAGRQDVPPSRIMKLGMKEEELHLIKDLMPAARDALLQQPSAKLARLCDVAAKLNMWKTIETLVSTSHVVHDRVLSGALQVHGAYYHVDSGKVQFLGEHPSESALMAERPTHESVRTGDDPSVPAEEALAILYAGNKRYAAGSGGRQTIYDEKLLIQLSEGGQNPIAVVLGCADSRAPVEILFDVRPGDLFVLRNAGNTCASATGSMIGSAEYAISHLKTKLLVVTGHTKCGAVTAAVDAVRTNQSADVHSSIGEVLSHIRESAELAVQMLPDSSMEEQVKLTTKLNVFSTLKKIIEYSSIVQNSIRKGELQIHGAVYDIFSGKVDWLGEHDELERIIGIKLPLYRWRTEKYICPLASRKACGPDSAAAAVDKLRVGNMRFATGVCQQSPSGAMSDPFAIVIGGAEVRVPIEQIFDVAPGELVVQRCMGSIAGRDGATLFSSIEYAVARFSPKLLVVLGESDSAIIDIALKQVSGAGLTSPAMRTVVDRVMVSAMRALVQVSKERVATAAGHDMKIRQLTVELNSFYTIEQLLKSQLIRKAVLDEDLELHAAVLNEQTGDVDFLGEHPHLQSLLRVDEAALVTPPRRIVQHVEDTFPTLLCASYDMSSKQAASCIEGQGLEG